MVRTVPKGTYSAPAIEKTFEIIELLAERPDGALVSEMAGELGRSVGELFRIVIVLERLGYLRKSARTDRYTVTYKLLDIAFRATPAQDLTRAALPEMQRLARETGQSCHFVVPNGGSGLVLAREEQPGMRGFSLKVGSRVDMIRSCSGQVILAFSTSQRADAIIEAAQAVATAEFDPSQLLDHLATIRKRGFDSRQSPITYGVTDISCPVFGFDGAVVGALTIPFLELIDGSQKVGLDEARTRLDEAVARISEALGHSAVSHAEPPSA
ncbi:IclR family transcriptional regulator [Sphingomonas sp. QA11]|uniref:IclR family transcriptional regulator n=1 Tax=Sphingomonas sp. QA11 TaxID=2950605 RepID=UPI00234B0DB0|nr:IclR family transcriptional regulator [Sphingomonas sp. QA11]WCM28633.1 IclR family transcriptional regulator [Sphingomonas sp. QA11]